MKDDDFRWGCRSGIQKAIRRGDLDLANTCFTTLWRFKQDRQWLKWRAVTLAVEEAWHLAGALADLYISRSEEESDWRAMIYKMTIATKSKDAYALWMLCSNGCEIDHQEANLMTEWSRPSEEPSKLSGDLVSSLKQLRPFSAYESKALDMLSLRTDQGGMLIDRQMCLAAMILIALRGLLQERVDEDIKAGARKWKERVKEKRNPVTVSLPWYIFDMHTQAGRHALNIFTRYKLKKYPGMTADDFKRIWFHLESAFTPNVLLKCTLKDERLTELDSRWWMPWLATALSFDGKIMPDVKQLWDSSLKKEIRQIVCWVIQKRDNEEKERS